MADTKEVDEKIMNIKFRNIWNKEKTKKRLIRKEEKYWVWQVKKTIKG